MGDNMDKRLVGTYEEITYDLALINVVAAEWWRSQGYTIVETESGQAVVGKNAATGADNPEALTTTWAEPVPEYFTIDEETGKTIAAGDTSWWIPSPSGDQRFYLWRDYLPEDVSIRCEEIVMPAHEPA